MGYQSDNCVVLRCMEKYGAFEEAIQTHGRLFPESEPGGSPSKALTLAYYWSSCQNKLDSLSRQPFSLIQPFPCLTAVYTYYPFSAFRPIVTRIAGPDDWVHYAPPYQTTMVFSVASQTPLHMSFGPFCALDTA